jgi:hypothetical protein
VWFRVGVKARVNVRDTAIMIWFILHLVIEGAQGR